MTDIYRSIFSTFEFRFLELLWTELDELPEFDVNGEINICKCYQTCNYTTYSQETSWAPYPGPLTDKTDINREVLGTDPTPSHVCYAE